MSNNEWTNNPVFLGLSPEKQAFFKKLQTQTKGKSPTQALPFLLEAMNTLKSNKLSFTPEETSLLMESLSSQLSSTEKMAFETLKSQLHS